MKIILRNDVKILLKNSEFWNFFPEYRELKEKIDNKKVRIGCCNMSDSIYREVLSYIKNNPKKWKIFFNTDAIQIYDKKAILL